MTAAANWHTSPGDDVRLACLCLATIGWTIAAFAAEERLRRCIAEQRRVLFDIGVAMANPRSGDRG